MARFVPGPYDRPTGPHLSRESLSRVAEEPDGGGEVDGGQDDFLADELNSAGSYWQVLSMEELGEELNAELNAASGLSGKAMPGKKIGSQRGAEINPKKQDEGTKQRFHESDENEWQAILGSGAVKVHT